MALLQQVIDVDKAFLPVARFRGATGQMWASGAILKAHLDLHTSAHRAILLIVSNDCRVKIESSTTIGVR
jgi:hypothetical protein